MYSVVQTSNNDAMFVFKHDLFKYTWLVAFVVYGHHDCILLALLSLRFDMYSFRSKLCNMLPHFKGTLVDHRAGYYIKICYQHVHIRLEREQLVVQMLADVRKAGTDAKLLQTHAHTRIPLVHV